MYDESIVHVQHAPSMFYMHYCGVVTAVMSKLTSQFQGKFCKLAEICKTEKLLSAVALSVNQEINKTETLPHGMYEVAISTNWKSAKLGVYHMASLDLLFCNNWKSAKLELYYVTSLAGVVLVDQDIAKSLLDSCLIL